jgi:hypothetical protein
MSARYVSKPRIVAAIDVDSGRVRKPFALPNWHYQVIEEEEQEQEQEPPEARAAIINLCEDDDGGD